MARKKVTRLIRVELLQPFDAILTRPKRSKVSRKIALFTQGPYSHAAIVVNQSLRFEAIGRGLTYTPVRFIACGFHGESLLFLEDVSAYRHFSVFRHPDLIDANGSTLSRLEERLTQLTSVLVYKQYPSLTAFSNVLRRAGLASSVVDRLFPMLSRVFQARRPLPGPFCSSLVAALFEDAGMSVFETGMPHNSVVPGDFARSRLVEVSIGADVPVTSLMNDALLLDEANGLARILALADRSYRAYQGLRIGFEGLKQRPSLLFEHDKEWPQLVDRMLEILRQTEVLAYCSSLNRRFWPAMVQIAECRRSCSTGCKLPRRCRVNADRVAAMVNDLGKELDASEDA